MSKEIYAIILAGDSGERLWPLEGMLHPNNTFAKQEEYTLFQQMFIKLVDCVDDKNIICATDTKNREYINKQLKELQEKFCRTTEYHIVEEPSPRGTMSAVGVSVRYILEKIVQEGEDPIIAVVPSDQIINGNFKLDYFLEKGKEIADAGYIVCMGTKTKTPSTHFGYMATRNDKKISEITKRGFKVSNFKEKPTVNEAKRLIKDKKVYANCGLYMFKASTFFAQLKTISPEVFNALKSVELNDCSPIVNLKSYETISQFSLETELIENSKKLAMISAKVDLKDCGYWDAIFDMNEKNKAGNVLIGNTADIDSQNSFVYSTSRLVATMGLKDTCVIETPETVFVCPKNEVVKIQKLRDKLKKSKNNNKLVNQTVMKPWGYYTVLQTGEGYLTKCIYVNPHARLSLQTHDHRSEHWVVLSGKALVIKGEQTLVLNVSEGIDIAVKEPHSLQNPYDEPLKILEIQTGELLSEDDIVRLEDIYGRV